MVHGVPYLSTKKNNHQQQDEKRPSACLPVINVHFPRHCPSVAIFFLSLVFGCFLFTNQ